MLLLLLILRFHNRIRINNCVILHLKKIVDVVVVVVVIVVVDVVATVLVKLRAS